MKSLIYRAAAREPMLRRARSGAAADGVTVFMYHDVGPDNGLIDAWQVVRASDFKAQVAYLRKHYDIINMDQAHELIDAEVSLDRPAAVLTFDDGLRGNYVTLLPLMRELQLPVAVYVATAHVEEQTIYWFDRIVNALGVSSSVFVDLTGWQLGSFKVRWPGGARRWADIQRILMAVKTLSASEADKIATTVEFQVARQTGRTHGTPVPVLGPMTIAMLQEMAQEPLVTLGSHTHGHELLPHLNSDQARVTIETSRQRIKRWTGHDTKHFAYPAGRSDQRIRELVADMGFATAVGTDTGIWNRNSDLFDIPRISVGRYDSLDKFKVNAVSGLRDVFRSTIS